MCGITGFCDTVDRVDSAPLRTMMDALRHRGPDGDGSYLDDHCAIGHLRLKIIDLSDLARQPMKTGDVVLAFNGEIYNYRLLKAELTDKYAFRSTSDTEVFLDGYAEWGEDIFRRVNGMFAAAIWNKRAKRLVLARDRLGKKPLFYYWDGRTKVVFGSELKALLQHPLVRRVIDEESLACFFAFGYVPTPRTIFKHIYKVPQGSTVTFENGCRTIKAYWELPAAEQPIREQDALDQLDSLLQDAVRIRLESDVPLGFFLSGGIDSSLVTAIGKKLAGDVRTFAAGFRDPIYDEAPFARAIAAHLGTAHTEVYLDESHFATFVDQATTYFDEPFADSSLIPTYYLARTTREHVTVALTGDGGDELFCGYQKYLNLTQLMPVLRVPDGLRSAMATALEWIPVNTARKVGSALHANSVDELVRWLVTIWKPDELAQLVTTSPDWASTQFERTWQRFGDRDPVSRFMAADIKSYLCDDILQKVDRASMAVALEVRSPLLDFRIVEFAMRLPLELKVNNGQQKYLLRKLLARYLPERLWTRKKHGFNVPVKAWYRRQRQDRIRVAIRELGARFPLATATMERFMRDHVSGISDYSQKLFSLEMLHQWVERYQ